MNDTAGSGPEEFIPHDMTIRAGTASNPFAGSGVAFSVVIHGVEHSSVMTPEQAFQLSRTLHECAEKAGLQNMGRKGQSWMN